MKDVVIVSACHTAKFFTQLLDISREAMDAVALRSHNNAEMAANDGSFADELVPVEVPRRKKAPIIFDKDEHFRSGITLEELAAQYLGCEKELNLNREITNINGSGIGLGHPIGSTGARIMTTLMYAMKNKRKNLGLATLCGGGGVSMACAIEML